MTTLNLTLIRDGRREDFVYEVKRIAAGGFCGRGPAEGTMKHIEELVKMGIIKAAPQKIPIFLPILKENIGCFDRIEVIGDQTSGEVEFIMYLKGSQIFIGICSDHTDRELEKVDIIKSKQVVPRVVSREVWLYDDIRSHWDNLKMEAYTKVSGKETLFQEAKLSSIMRPEDIIAHLKENVRCDLDGMVVLSGTVGSLTGKPGFGDYFKVELIDDVKKRKLTCSYTIRPLDWIEYVQI